MFLVECTMKIPIAIIADSKEEAEKIIEKDIAKEINLPTENYKFNTKEMTDISEVPEIIRDECLYIKDIFNEDQEITVSDFFRKKQSTCF